ncbi:MAG: hypothetical protein IJ966_02440 [Bacilli bacterium]|nr:hypothetical protein [Bacilli bacterium]
MKKIFFVILCFILIIASPKLMTKAAYYLDRIDEYEITVDPRKDGTLDMLFNIKWTVLDSTSEGPLEWVKIGIPNKYVDEIKGLSPNIKKIKYFSDSGSFIRIDLDKKYYANETLDISFSIHQSRMYFLEGDHCYYDYNPGWFNDIIVSHAKVKWNKAGVIDSNLDDIKDDYYYYETQLHASSTFKVKMKYDQSYFDSLDSKKQYSDAYMTTGEIIGIIAIFVVVIIIIVVALIAARANADPYLYERGFVGHHYYYRRRYYHSGYYSSGKRITVPQTVNSTNFRGGSGGCACACACACAGGGRAGCSMKDFYKHPSLEKVRKGLKK